MFTIFGAMKKNHDIDNHEDDDKDDNTINLFEQEERDLVEIQLTPAASVLRLRQFGSHDDRWGIHSTVWEGGVALLHYAVTHYEPIAMLIQQKFRENGEVARPHGVDESLFVLDLGSGTGITGLGIAALTHGLVRVALTDLPEALPLLRDNLNLNLQILISQSTMVRELTWGCTMPTEWLPEFLEVVDEKHDVAEASLSLNLNNHRKLRRLLITGADIVYRPSLFIPLLSTLVHLYDELHEIAAIDIWLSCQSIRTHLNEFWDTAVLYGFTTKMIAVARKQGGDGIHDLSQIVIEAVSNESEPPFSTFSKGLGINWIVALTRN